METKKKFLVVVVFLELFLISQEKNSKTSMVNQQSVINLLIYHYFSKNVGRTITFNSVTLKNTQTEPQFFFNETNII